MSHFLVVVIGKDPESVDDQLAPFAEQDFDLQYGEFMDREDEFRETYSTGEVCAVKGETGGYRISYEKEDTPGVERIKYTEMFESFEVFMAHIYSMDETDKVNGRYGVWVNPNAKWDWYQEGGRWDGFFKSIHNTECNKPVGLLQRLAGYTRPTGRVNQLQVKELDIEGMQQEAIVAANAEYDEIEKILRGRELPSWKTYAEQYPDDLKEARNQYHNDPRVKDLAKIGVYSFTDIAEEYGPNREAYIERVKKNVLVPAAILKDGVWHEPSKMGWFGITLNETMSPQQWHDYVWDIYKSLDQNDYLTAVDCHI